MTGGCDIRDCAADNNNNNNNIIRRLVAVAAASTEYDDAISHMHTTLIDGELVVG